MTLLCGTFHSEFLLSHFSSSLLGVMKEQLSYLQCYPQRLLRTELYTWI